MTLVPSTEFLKKECNFYISSFDHVQGLHGRILKKSILSSISSCVDLGHGQNCKENKLATKRHIYMDKR